jgi:hypothetical protein
LATWKQFAAEAPDLAYAVRARFEVAKHHVLATLRADGSPRVSGTEVRIVGDDLTLGSMTGAVKVADLRRDGRFALHANPGDASMEGGDAKVSGVAIEVPDDSAASDPGVEESHSFRLDLTEAVLTSIEGGDHLLIQSWRPGEGVKEVRRK